MRRNRITRVMGGGFGGCTINLVKMNFMIASLPKQKKLSRLNLEEVLKYTM